MPGYRTIPTKDTFDVDEKLGGIVTVKQLAYVIAGCVLTYFTFIISSALFGDTSDTIYIWGSVLFLSLVFTFSNADKWLALRFKYYVLSNNERVERDPSILRNLQSGEEDKLVTLDGRVIAVLKVTPINFPLLSDEAKEGKIGAYETYLRQLVYPIMHLVQSDEVDVQGYSMRAIQDAEAAQARGAEGILDYCSKHIKFLNTFLKKNKSRAKNHYVVLQVRDPRYQGGHVNTQSPMLDSFMLWVRSLATEFRPESIFEGGRPFVKPRNFVHIDSIGKRMIYSDPSLIPPQLPARSTQVGAIMQFESLVSMLRYARSQREKNYYGNVDLDELMRKEFYEMSLAMREKEFSIDERRRHVGISGGKTRWAFDEAEKHIAVLTDKLEGAGLRIKRLRGGELYSGPHMSMSAASKVKVGPKHLQVDNTFMQVVYATGYPYQVNLGWLSNIVDGREDYDMAMYIYPIPIQEALSTFRSARLKLSTEKKARGDFLDPETEQHLDDVTNFYSQIVAGKEKYFLSSLYITGKAQTLKSLDTVMEKCKSDLAGASIDFDVAYYDMAKAVYTTRITGHDALAKKREFPSSSLAATFPHISSSLEIDPGGIFFAFDWMNTPVIMDLKKLPNQHISILGESGSGKSYFAKSIIPRYLMAGYRVFVTDPDGEYTEIAKHFGGSVSSVGPSSGMSINPFDLEEGREVNDKARSLLGMFSIICGQLTKFQEGIISEVLLELYSSKKKTRQITMSTFAKELQKRLSRAKDLQMRHDLQFLLIAIKPFLRGSLYGFIDKPTTVRIQSRIHVFDLREYQNDKTLKDFFNYLIFDYISHHLLSDKSLKAMFMDEGWTMVNYAGSEDYVRYIIKDSRKYNVSFVFITQELEDMLSSQAGRSILNNTSTQFIFHQKESAMPLMEKTLSLTVPEYERLIACSKGEGLMVSDKSRLFFRVQTSRDEHEIISRVLESKKKEIIAQKPASLQKQEMEEALSPSLKAALGMSPVLARSIGMSENKEGAIPRALKMVGLEKLPQSLPPLPIAITHNLVSEEEMAKILLGRAVKIPGLKEIHNKLKEYRKKNPAPKALKKKKGKK